MLMYSAGEEKVWAISGHGIAPRTATMELYQRYGLDVIPGDGFLPALVPPAVASWILLLRRFGTMRLSDVLGPAVALAEEGFPMYDALYHSIAGHAQRFRQEWPSSAEVFLPGGEPPPIGTIWQQRYWAATFGRLMAADNRFSKREDGLRAAYDAFYRGEIAEAIVEFCGANPIRDPSGEAHASLLTLDDFDAYEARAEEGG